MSTLGYQWHDQHLTEEFSTVIRSLGADGARVIEINKTDHGYQFVECCDGYFGTTLNQEQMVCFIRELQEMAGLNK
ncbi:MAG: hypothetical protein AAF542_19325 [Pseudomonadota bacterium]